MGDRQGTEGELRRDTSKLPGRWVIYEVLKSIFEAVIYLAALSLNKHRIRLIIVTVETQHRTTSPSLPAPLLRGSAPGADPHISPQLHPSGRRRCAPKAPGSQPPTLALILARLSPFLSPVPAMWLQQDGGTLGLDSLSLSSEFSWVVGTWPGLDFLHGQINSLLVVDLERNPGCHLW